MELTQHLDVLEAQIVTVIGWVDNVTNLDECQTVGKDQVDFGPQSCRQARGNIGGKCNLTQGQLVDDLAKLEVLTIAFG